MRRRVMAIALATATAASLLIAPQAQAFTNQRINWAKCTDLPDIGIPTDRLQCGTFTAPMDWHNPNNGKTITIAVSRMMPKSGTAKTTILTNPGGPGGEGRYVPLIYTERPKLSEHAEIIGIDVRGTGGSDNATCGNLTNLGSVDPRDRSKANLDLLYGGWELLAKFCQAKSGEFGRYITTEQTVRDLDLLRQVLGRKKVDWLGYSGGSWMGAYYATYFPKSLDKIVIDSNTDFTADWQTIFGEWGMGFERRFRVDFLPWVAKYDDTYHLGKTAEEVRLNYERARQQLVQQPIPLPGGQLLDALLLDSVLAQSLYAGVMFERGAGVLAELLGTVPSTKVAQYPDFLVGTRYGILCNDTPFRGDRRSLEREAIRNGAKWPLYGYNQMHAPCAYWDRPNVQLKKPTGQGVDSVLMVQSERDPATPIEGAQRAHRKFKNSVMLTVTDNGDHGVYGFDNQCVNDLVERYLVDREVPRKDLTCQGNPLPAPGQEPTVARKARAAGAQLG